MEKKSTIIAILGLVVILGLVWSKQYGLNPDTNFSSAESVALRYIEAFMEAPNAGFLNRQDKAAYDLLAIEAKEEIDAKTGPLFSRLVEFNGGSLPLSSFTINNLTEQGDKASVDFTLVGKSETKKTIFLVKRGEKWEVYSVVNTK